MLLVVSPCVRDCDLLELLVCLVHTTKPYWKPPYRSPSHHIDHYYLNERHMYLLYPRPLCLKECSSRGIVNYGSATHSYKHTKVKQTALKDECPLSSNNVISRTFDHSGGVLTNKDGIKITIPEGAIKDGDSVMLYTVVDLCGPFVFPSKCQADVVSPYYWIGVDGSYQFYKPVQVEFEHFAVVTDPSHYQLLCCKDDDNTMQPVDYDLNFNVQHGISWCSFQTYHFCSYCLFYKYKFSDSMKIIGLFYFKSKNYLYSCSFNVQILFSFATSHCINRIRALCEKEGMIFECAGLFEASSDKASTSYFKLSYDQSIDGWQIDYSGPTNLIIKTKKVNFFNYYTKFEELKAHEEMSIFPPRFKFQVRSTRHSRTQLQTKFNVRLYKEKTQEPDDDIILNLLVPAPATSIAHLIGEHDCDCQSNKVEFTHLMKFSEKIAKDWQKIAIHLNIPNEKIAVIDIDHPYVMPKCNAMFKMWLQLQSTPPCGATLYGPCMLLI